MVKRKTLSPKVRFEIFKRDSFTCQYCGRSAPEVILRCDHIHPVAKDGDNDLTNLITACFDCNAGKGDRLLDDASEIEKQQKQLAQLQERRNQIQMMKKWRDECLAIDSEMVDTIEQDFRRTFDKSFTDVGRKDMTKLIKRYGFGEIMECVAIACEQYEDAGTAFGKVAGIARCRQVDRENPGLGKLPYVAAILRNRSLHVGHNQLKILFDELISRRKSVDKVIELAKTERTWTRFIDASWNYVRSREDA